MRTQTKEIQTHLTPAKALQLLVDGNQRFQANLKANRNLLEQVNATADGQFPFATILSCIDSRTSSELTFDQGLGDVFSVRIAGNVLNDDILGSMEFACKLAGSKLLVVLGHTSCGAIKGACDGAQLGHLTGLLSKIQPAVLAETSGNGPTEVGEDLVQRVASRNVELTVQAIRERSAVLHEMIDAGEVGLIGGMYSIQTGEVTFGDLICGV